MRSYDEIKKEVDDYIKKQDELSPCQKILKELERILSSSRRYLDYCNEIKTIYDNHIEVICLADFFFVDCSIVFNKMAILELSKLLDNDLRTICIEKFFNKLKSVEAKKLGISESVNNLYDSDLNELENIRNEFKRFKNKRDKEIAHLDESTIGRNIIESLDRSTLEDIQSKTFDLLVKYFELLSLPKPGKLSDQSSFESLQIIPGLDTINHVIMRALTELDFTKNGKVFGILESVKVMNIIKNMPVDE